MQLIKRESYLKRLREFKDTEFIKIITGLRRVGKSSLLELFEEELLAEGIPEANIIALNFDSLQHTDLLDYKSLYAYVQKHKAAKGKMYIFLDEIQEVQEWQRAINSFKIDFDCDIYLTGSNAWLFSSQLSTLLAGRYVEIKLLPLSFSEFLLFNTLPKSMSDEEKFRYYLSFGGMPSLRELKFNRPRITEALEGIYATVILKDVLARKKITEHATLRKIVTFLADNVGNITSTNSLSKVLVNEGDIRRGAKPALKTLHEYLQALLDAFVFYRVERFDVKGKQILKTLQKYYIVDLGIRNMLLGERDFDYGHILENVVYFELLHRGYKIFIGKIGDKEIDFLVETPTDKKYIQVTETIRGEAARQRELAPLLALKDNYEKIILTMDRPLGNSYQGIKIINLIDWLLGKNEG
jgi:predicted AAA+ superfamily ATPase